MSILPITLLNPGAEDGTGYDGDPPSTPVTIPHWTQVTGTPSVVLWANTHGFPTNSDPGPPSRGNNYFFGGPSNALSVLTQTLSFAGYESLVDASNVTFALSAYLGGCPGQEDNAVISLVWKDGGGATIGTTPQIGPVTNADRGGVNALLFRSIVGTVPPNARTVVVTMTLTRTAGSDNDGYADEISLVFSDITVGDFEDVPCDCPAVDTTPHAGTLAPTVLDVGDFEDVRCETCPFIQIVSPAAGTAQPSDPLVFDLLGGGTLSTFTATITDASGVPVIAYNFGFVNGFSGNDDDPIDGGGRYTINAPLIGWPVGPLRLDVSVTTAAPAFAVASRSWDVEAAAGYYVDQALARVIIQYRESKKLLSTIKVHAGLAQQIDDCVRQIAPFDDPAVATGINLDVTAALVGQDRQIGNGDIADDAELEILIGARVTRNNTHVSAAEYLESLVQFFGAKINLADHGGMALSYVVLRQPTADEVALLNGDIVARPMGVKVSRAWAPTDYFGFSRDPNAKGFAGPGSPTGGHLARGF